MKRHARRRLALTGWLIIVALCLGLWPQPSAAIRALVKLADDNATWSNGRFFRTGLALSTVGGVQLVPVKVQTQYQRTQDLPRDLSAHTSLTYRDRLFVIGGNTPYVESPSNLVKSEGVFATKLSDPQSGALQPWSTLPNLIEPIADAPAVVVEVGSRSFLVVLGGSRGRTAANFNEGGDLDQVTTDKIRYYQLVEDNAGNLTTQTWKTAASRLPYEPNYDLCDPTPPNICDAIGSGARGMAAVAVNVGGAPYIYLFGGRSRVFDGAQYVDRFFGTVFKAPVTFDGTNLVLGAWQELPESQDIQYQRQDLAWQTVDLAGAATVTFTDPLDNSVGVYLVGGANDATTYDANAYVARIDTTTGAVTWLPNGNMSGTRTSHAAVQSDGTITVSGGRTNNNIPTTSLAQGYIDDEPPLTLYRNPLNPDAANFDLSQGALLEARMLHRMEALPAGQYGDWAYIIGGQVLQSGGTVTPADRRVLVGNLDTPPVDGDTFVSDGKYYSKIFDFGDNTAEYFGFKWNAIIGANQNISLAYRVGNNAQDLGPLTTIPGGSQNGDNTYMFPASLSGRYIQFVATLTSTGGAGSPTLSAISVDINRTGFPNARSASAPNTPKITPDPIALSSNIVPVVMITNQAFDVNNPALAANWDAPGTFFVDMYVVPPGTTPTPPVFGQTESVAYVEVNKAFLDAGKDYSIPAGNWRPADCNAPPCSAVNWRGVFNRAGTYNIYIMVDSLDPASYNAAPAGSEQRLFGNLKESDVTNTLGETDNIFGPFTVTVSNAPDNLFLPIVTSRVSSAVTPLRTKERLPRVHTIDGSH